jgi:hypothetical protein
VVEPPTFGLPAAFTAEPVGVSVERLVRKFAEGRERYRDLWRTALARATLDELEGSSTRTDDRGIDRVLWIRIVYDFLVAYNSRRVDSGPLLDALIPLYFARTAAFVHEVAELTNEKAEEAVDDVVDAAIRLKPTLRARWRKEGVPERSLAEHSVPEGEPVEELASGSV